MSNSHESSTSTSSDSHSHSHESSVSTTSSSPQTPNSLVLQTSAMPPADRSQGRNVHIYDFENPTVLLGGPILSNGITNANLYSMLKMFIQYKEPVSPEDDEPFLLLDENGNRIENSGGPLQPGKFYVVSIGKVFTTPLHD